MTMTTTTTEATEEAHCATCRRDPFGPGGHSMMIPGPHGSMLLRDGHRTEDTWRRLWGNLRRARNAAAMRAYNRGHHGSAVSAAEKRAAWESAADRQRAITAEYARPKPAVDTAGHCGVVELPPHLR